MSLSSLSSLKVYLRIASSDTSQDTNLSQILAGAEAAAVRFTKREFSLAVYVEYPRLLGQPQLALRNRPVRLYQKATTLVASSATATVASTTGLVAGMPAVLDDYLPIGTTISAVVNGTTLTLSAVALASGTPTVCYGLAAWQDVQGYAGQRADAFPDGTHLTLGSDFMLEPDQADGSSKSGLLTRLGGGNLTLAGAVDWPYPWPGVGRSGRLSGRLAPIWAKVAGSVKVVYAAGYDASSLPAELTLAANQLAAAIRVQTPAGVPLDVTAITGQWVDLLSRPARNEPPELSSARMTLRAYRELSV